VRAILELGVGAADQPQVGLVNEAGGVERVAVLVAQLPARHRMQLAVERGQHTV
jgi:hypothetical protein